MKKQTKKKGWIILFVALCLLIPLVIITFIIHQNLDDDLSKGSISYIVIEHDGQENKIDAEETVSFFTRLAQSGEAIEKPVHDAEEYRLFTITFHKLNSDFPYRFYLSDSVQDCVYADNNGAWHLIPSDLAAELLAHPLIGTQAVSFAYRPHLALAQGGKEYSAAKIEGEWNYIKATGEFDHKVIAEQSDEKAVLPQGEDLNLVFSLQPDFCSILLTQDSEILYSGDPEKMETLALDDDAFLELVVSCDWYEKDRRDYHGAMEYTFRLYYDVPTKIELLSSAARPGETFAMTIAHSASDSFAVTATFPAEKARLECENGVWTAFVPVLPEATPGDYSIMVMGSDTEETLAVQILPPQE